MIFEGIFGTWECIAAFCCIGIMPLVLTLPTFSAEQFGTASLLHILYVSAITAFLFFTAFKLLKKFKEKDILDISHFLGGNVLKYIVGIIIILFLFFETFVSLSEFTINVQNTLFHESPQEHIAILFTITILISSFIGLKGVFRVAALIAPIIIISFIALFFSLSPSVDLINFAPIFGNGIKTFFTTGTFHTACFECLALLFLLAPNVKSISKVSTLTFGFITLLTAITYFLIFGLISYPSVTDNYAAIYEITKLISYGRFIQRVESIYILTWLLATFIYLSTGICCIVKITKKLFGINDFKRIIPAICISLLCASLMLSSYVELLTFRKFLATYITPLIIIILPLFILTFANIKLKHKEST